MSKIGDAFTQGKVGKKAFHLRDDGTLPPVLLRNDLTDIRAEVDEGLEHSGEGEQGMFLLLTGIRAELRYMNDKADYQ